MDTEIKGLWTTLNFGTAHDPMIVVKLRSTSRVNKIRGLASGCLFYKQPEIYFSAQDAPSPPDVQPGAWVKVNVVRTVPVFSSKEPLARVSVT